MSEIFEQLPVLYTVADGVAVITLNRPDVRNAINLATAEALTAAFDRLDADPDATVAVLTGAGDMFCAGMDLKALSSGEPRPFTELRGMFGITAKPGEAADRRRRAVRARGRAGDRTGV